MGTNRLRVALLSGGRSGEREVSLNGGAQVKSSLSPSKYIVTDYDPATDLDRLAKDAPNLDVALIIMHGRWGEDGTIQGYLDLLGLPYQGSGVLASALCMDKRATKDMYRLHGLPVVKDLVLRRDELLGRDEIIDNLGLPIVVKPSCEGSSLGVTIASTPEELEKGIFDALACGAWIILEQYLEGREITSAVIGNEEPEALPLIEISPGEGYDFFTYDAKYLPGASREICPAPLPDDLTLEAQELSKAAHKALYCSGYSRTDMILKDGRYHLLETNTIPGMTSTSLFPQAARAAGMDFSAMMDRLIELALAKQK